MGIWSPDGGLAVVWGSVRPSVFRDTSIFQFVCQGRIRNSVTNQVKRKDAPERKMNDYGRETDWYSKQLQLGFPSIHPPVEC